MDQAGGTSALRFGREPATVAVPSPLDRLRLAIGRTDWTPDLGTRIGSAEWWRGALTCTALCAATLLLSPGLHRSVIGRVPAPLQGTEWDEARAQSIAPLAWGAGSGRHVAANDLVAPLTSTPERPRLELMATLGDGDSFGNVLRRAGVAPGDADRAATLISGAVPPGEIPSGTQIALTLGRRDNRTQPRPLEALAFRARFDLSLSLARAGDALTLSRQAIAIDRTPLRIQGLVGSSLYRSMRAAGAPARAVETYIRALATRLSIGSDVGAGDIFDVTLRQARAATGEVELGTVMFVGLNQGTRRTQLVQWGDGDAAQWYDADGSFEQRGAMGLPVAGHITSVFGWRMHPILHILRMHRGIDIGAPWGTPIHAPLDGVVALAARTGGYGNFVRLDHAGGLQTGYGHLSQIAVSPGMHVVRGEVIGFVGSSGMSTGPHLHWEVSRNGVLVDPATVAMASVQTLSGDALRAFRARVAELLAVRVGPSR